MLDTILTTTSGESLTIINTIIITFSSILFGVIISLIYMETHKKEGYNSAFVTTLIMLPVIISIIILLIGNNVARAFSLAGAFSIIRFRSAPGNPKDIAYVFFTLAVGLALGMGYIGYGAMFTMILSIVMLVLEKLQFGKVDNKLLQLKITIPENLNYEETFDEVLSNYTTSWYMEKIKTKEFGALFELTYKVRMKNSESKKKFIDDLRCRNGNLNIIFTMCESNWES